MTDTRWPPVGETLGPYHIDGTDTVAFTHRSAMFEFESASANEHPRLADHVMAPTAERLTEVLATVLARPEDALFGWAAHILHLDGHAPTCLCETCLGQRAVHLDGVSVDGGALREWVASVRGAWGIYLWTDIDSEPHKTGLCAQLTDQHGEVTHAMFLVQMFGWERDLRTVMAGDGCCPHCGGPYCLAGEHCLGLSTCDPEVAHG